jgi:hypothetical protein
MTLMTNCQMVGFARSLQHLGRLWNKLITRSQSAGLRRRSSVALSFAQQELQELNRRMMLSAGNGTTRVSVDISINSYVSELPFQAESRYQYLKYGAQQVRSHA